MKVGVGKVKSHHGNEQGLEKNQIPQYAPALAEAPKQM